MKKAILGKKIGMTQIFVADGRALTIVRLKPGSIRLIVQTAKRFA